jgi:hypothetical protein
MHITKKLEFDEDFSSNQICTVFCMHNSRDIIYFNYYLLVNNDDSLQLCNKLLVQR